MWLTLVTYILNESESNEEETFFRKRITEKQVNCEEKTQGFVFKSFHL